MEILLVTDGQGWIVDRISNKYQGLISNHHIDIVKASVLTPEKLYEKSFFYDLIHYNNWGMKKYSKVISKIATPQVMSVRSFRLQPFAFELSSYMKKTHIIHPDMFTLGFNNPVYVPDGIFIEDKQRRPFVVGMAFQNTPENYEYKGYNLVKKVCDELNITLKVAHNLSPDEMIGWYRSLDLFICASENEGFSAPAMECLLLNTPVLTTEVGIPAFLPCHTFERNYDSLLYEIKKFYTSPQVISDYSWDHICKLINERIYEKAI
jgi:hypothetical protein